MVFTCYSVASKFTESIKKKSNRVASVQVSMNPSKIFLTSGDSIKWFKNIFDIWGQYQMIQKYLWHLGTVSNASKISLTSGDSIKWFKNIFDICVSVIGFNNIFNLRANIKSVKIFLFTSVSILKASTIPKVPNISNIFFLNLSQ